MALVIIDGILREVPDDTTPTITPIDGTSDVLSLAVITKWNPSAESANVIDTLIDGSIAVTLLGDQPRTGDLECIFTSDLEAEVARRLLGRPTAFDLVVPTQPLMNIRFVRRGRISPALHDDLEGVWTFTVGFQEVIP